MMPADLQTPMKDAGSSASDSDDAQAAEPLPPYPYPVSHIEAVPTDTIAAGSSVDVSESATQNAASIMRNMSWGDVNDTAAPHVENSVGGSNSIEMGADNAALMAELHARSVAQAAAAIGISASDALSAMPMLPSLAGNGDASQAAAFHMVTHTGQGEDGVIDDPDEIAHGEVIPHDEGESGQPGEQSFTCTVCRKVFKREMNLIFHMTTHRPRQPQLETAEPTSTQPVKCQDCGKEFATKYQAKKHFLRRHFQGDKPFACNKCGKKRFVVKEDLTMHMKSCGNVYVCNCGIRLCSLGALKRHCKYFSHEPESLEPRPDPSANALDWNGLQTISTVASAEGAGRNGVPAAEAGGSAMMQPNQLLASAYAASNFPGATGQSSASLQGLSRIGGAGLGGPGLSGALLGSTGLSSGAMQGLLSSALQQQGSEQALSVALCSHAALMHAMMANGGAQGATLGGMAMNAGAPALGALGGQGQISLGGLGALSQFSGGYTSGLDASGAPSASRDSAGPGSWQPDVLNGMMPSLAQALRQAQAEHQYRVGPTGVDGLSHMQQNVARDWGAASSAPSAEELAAVLGAGHRRVAPEDEGPFKRIKAAE